jgi:membrane associated rhomboid family serine protease
MDPTSPEPGAPSPDPRTQGPLDRDTALTFLSIGDRLLANGDFQDAGGYYQRVIGFDDPAITAAATLGVGNVLYRLDRDADALATWRRVLDIGETPSTYPALRQIAAALVRDGDLAGATAAYREADKRAPAVDKAEIASRLGWLAKETGDSRGARRYFARSRGGSGLPIPLTYVIIGVTVIVSLTASTEDGFAIQQALWLDRAAIAAGEWWRLFTVTLVHGGLLHLALNMYALYLVGPIVERFYGWKIFGLMYVLCALAGSIASFIVGDPGVPSVGASGAIFGLFGVVLAATRIHAPLLDRQGRAMVGQIGTLIVINLIFGFGFNAGGGNIDNAAHVGGLLAGLWLGFALVPGNVQTARGLWQSRADGGSGTTSGGGPIDRRLEGLVRLLAVVALVAAILVGLAIGSDPNRFVGPTAPGQSVAGAGVSGSTTLSRAPCGATFSATASPPCARASSRTIARPSPVPVPLRLGSPR